MSHPAIAPLYGMRPALLLMFALSGRLFAQPALTAADLSHLQGGWSGELMYINYDDGTPSTIPATLLFEPMARTSGASATVAQRSRMRTNGTPYRSVRMAGPSMVAPRRT